MAGLNEPKKETVGADLPLSTAGKSQDQNVKETVRIQLPLRETVGTAPPHAPTELQSDTEFSAPDFTSSEFSGPAKPLSFSTPSSASEMPAPASLSSELKKETVRILPIPDPAPTGQIENTQSVIAMPEVAPENASIGLASPEKSTMLLYWILLGVSALILIIQIWTYFS